MNNSSEFANQRLREAGRAKDRAKRLAWAFVIGAALLEVLLGVALIDYWLALPAGLRMAGFMLLLLLLATGLGGWLKLRRRPTTIKEAALDTESQRPDLGCVISTAAEYTTGERSITHEYEPELVAALEQQAARNLHQAQISYTNKLLRPASFLAFALLTLLLFAAVAPVAFTAFKRTISPWSKETYTKVEVTPGSVDIPVGQDVDITNLFSGRLPKNPAIHWQQTNQPAWQSVALKASADGFYTYPFKKLQSSVKYQVTGNDAVSEVYEITTYVPPEVRALRVDVAYPEYTRVKPFFQTVPELTVLRASDLTFRITASTKLTKARLRFSGMPSIDLSAGENDQWSARVKAVTNADYWIELADAKGHGATNGQPYHLKVLPDNPPKIEITEPGEDMRAEATNTLPLKFAARDDFGISEIKIVYNKLGGPNQEIKCAFTNDGKGEFMGGAELALTGLNLKEYELVSYHAEARDNNTLDGPGVGVSPVYFIEITSEEGGAHPKSKPKSEGQRLNLLVIQKQIIADTTVLASKAGADKFDELASRQKEAVDFAEIYHESLGKFAAPPEAVKLMEDALREMKSASGSLAERKREAALPAEEKALADLYQIMKVLPRLGNIPIEPPPPSEEQPKPDPALQVVLEAIKKQKKELASNEEVAEALEEAKKLSRAQAQVLPPADEPGQSTENAGQGSKTSKAGPKAEGEKESNEAKAQAKPGEKKQAEEAQAEAKKEGEKKQGEQAKAGAKPGQGKEGQGGKAGTKPGEGKDGQEAKAAGKPGEGKKADQAKADAKAGEGKEGDGKEGEGAEAKPADEKETENLEKMAELESQLSKQAEALAAKLEKLAGKDTRLGHNAARQASKAAGQMGAAGQSLRQGNLGAAGTEGGQSLLSLDKVIAALQRLDQPNLTDVATEDFPKEYEALISEYLRKLSHEK